MSLQLSCVVFISCVSMVASHVRPIVSVDDTHDWAMSLGVTATADTLNSFATHNGQVYIGGGFASSVAFGCDGVTCVYEQEIRPADNQLVHSYVAGMSNTSEPLWVTTFRNTTITQVAAFKGQQVLIGGAMHGYVEFGLPQPDDDSERNCPRGSHCLLQPKALPLPEVSHGTWIGALNKSGMPQWATSVTYTSLTDLQVGHDDDDAPANAPQIAAVLCGQLFKPGCPLNQTSGEPLPGCPTSGYAAQFGNVHVNSYWKDGRDGYVALLAAPADDVTNELPGHHPAGTFRWAFRVPDSTVQKVCRANGHVVAIGHMPAAFRNVSHELWGSTFDVPNCTGVTGNFSNITESLWGTTPNCTLRNLPWIAAFDENSGVLMWHETLPEEISIESIDCRDQQVVVGGNILANSTLTLSFGNASVGSLSLTTPANGGWIGALSTDGEWEWLRAVAGASIEHVALEMEEQVWDAESSSWGDAPTQLAVLGHAEGAVAIGLETVSPGLAWAALLNSTSQVWLQLLTLGTEEPTDLQMSHNTLFSFGYFTGSVTLQQQLPLVGAIRTHPEEFTLQASANTQRDYWLWAGSLVTDDLLPILQETTPVHGDVNQSANVVISLFLDEPVFLSGSAEEFIYLLPVASCEDQFNREEFTIAIHTADETQVVISHGTGTNITIQSNQLLLPYGLTYTVGIGPGLFVDAAGNSWAGLRAAAGNNFTGDLMFRSVQTNSFSTNSLYAVNLTGAPNSPLVATVFSPLRGELAAHRSTDISFEFNRPVKFGFGSILLTSVGGVDYDEYRRYELNDTQLNITDGGYKLSIMPDWDLDNRANKNYTLIMPECALLDQTSNVPFFGFTRANLNHYQFRVVDEDVPVIDVFSPHNGQVGVSRSSDIVLTFNESVFMNVGFVHLIPTGGDHVGRILEISVPPLDHVSRNRFICAGKVCTIDPRHYLDDEAGTNWRITMTTGTLLDGAGNPFIGLSDADYGFFVNDTTPTLPVYPSIHGYPWTRPELKYKTSRFESHMGPARVYGEDGFHYPGFRTLDGLSLVADAEAVAVGALKVRREDVFADGLDSIMEGANYHYSPLAKTAVKFSYHSVSYDNSTAVGDAFDDVSGWTFADQYATSLFGGELNGFGSFYAAQAYTQGFTCMSWSRTDRDGYKHTMAFRLHPVAGLPNLRISGHLDSMRYNSRPSQENTTISWKLIRYFGDSLLQDFELLSEGKYLLKNVGTEEPIVVEGDTGIGDEPRYTTIQVNNFVEGSIALVVRNEYTEEIPSYGHLLVCDDITWHFSPQIPYTAALPDVSPLLVDPANGTTYSVQLTMEKPDSVGALWHTAKAVVGLGFDSTFSFKISHGSRNCQVFPELQKHCETRGGDGFAFVIHNGLNGSEAFGDIGGGCGYHNMDTALAIEFDTWNNPEDRDPYNNHISVHTGGTSSRISSHHKQSLASTTDIPNLADNQVHTVRVTYNNTIDLNGFITRQRGRQAKDRFQAPVMAFNNVAQLLNKDTAKYRPGLLSIYLDDMTQPLMQIPMNLASILGLDAGGLYGSQAQTAKAWVGFTASTGSAWQRHEIFDWVYTALPTQHAAPMRPDYCSHNILPASDDPTCHLPTWTSRPDDTYTSQHVSRDPRDLRSDGHNSHPEYGGGHPDTTWNTNFDKFYKPQGLTHPVLRPNGEVHRPEWNIHKDPIKSGQVFNDHLLPSDGRITEYDMD